MGKQEMFVKAVTGAQMGEIDKYSIEKLCIPGIVLMENAALQIVKHVDSYFKEKPELQNNVLIVSGKGNNAGDAFAVARHLIVKGYEVQLVCLFDKVFLSGDALLNFVITEKLGAHIGFFNETSPITELKNEICKSELVIDGIFGTGFRGQVKGYIADVIQSINNYSKYILSIDIASGIESATGKVPGDCIRADKTVTFELPKIGQLVYPGAEYTGQLAVEGIGMPAEAVDSIKADTFLTEPGLINKIIPKRGAGFNKGSCGKVAVVTGSQGMAGSGCLTSRAALRTGSGLVYIAAPKSLMNIYQSVVPEAVCTGLEEQDGIVSPDSAETIINIMKKCHVAVVGPGLSSSRSIYYLVNNIADQTDLPVVLDADALNALSADTSIFGKFKNEVVITPHPGEMSRLTGLEINYIQENRLEVARKYSRLWGVTVVLKGAGTIIADRDGSAFINPTGNPGMATAGSGDSLAGIIASLVGQSTNGFEAAVAGVYLHGMAGDLAACEKGEYGLTASDIVDNIPYAIKKVMNLITDFSGITPKKPYY
ncbi:MAG: carbohydrate kinase, YjeF related protein [Eubacterium sp.]|jgi:NAD(P)H-hydrate epimerase|nr:carbohydrate kinase, YjeF related protein [Eubacterium sp.]